MATKKFVMEIPLILHEMVQEFVVSALSARPSNYVDFAVEYYLHLQTKQDRILYDSVGANSVFRSPEDSDEVCENGEALSDTANVYQVSIHPEAFHSPPNKLYPSDDEDSPLTDLPCSDRAVPTKTNNPTILNHQSLPNTKLDTNSLAINSHSLPTSPPFTFSVQGSSFNVTNSMSILPISSPIVNNTSTPNLPFNYTLQSPIALTANSQPSTPNNTPATTLNSPMSLHMVGEGNSEHSSPFTPPLKNNFSNLSLTEECMQPDKANQNHFQCKSCRGVFKPHPRPHTQPFLSLPSNSLVDPSLSNSTLSLPERPQVYSLLPTSHIHPTDAFNSNSSPPTYYTTTNQPPHNYKSTPDLSERKFHCHICERSYKSNTGLKRHLIVHSGERPFQCHYCFKSFYRKYVLTTHISRVHNKLIASSQS